MASLLIGALPMATKALSLSSSSRSKTPIAICFSASASSTSPPFIYCGRGDKKTAKGKRFNHSFGNARPRNKTKGRGPPRAPVPPSPRRKDRFDDGDEKIEIEIDESLFS